MSIMASGSGRPARRVGRRALLACALPLGGCAWLDVKQRELALRPTAARPGERADLRPGDIRYAVPAVSSDESPGQLALWWMPHPAVGAPALLYLHGTFRNLYRNLPKIDALRAAGFAILGVDYRGWGDSTPIVPSEATIVADAWQAWTELVRWQPDPARRVIFGHSMGGAVAVQVASALRAGADYAALVLESTFTRMPDIAAEAGFWGRVLAAATTLEFDAEARIGRVDAPILMLHGSADDTVPVTLGRRLRDAAPSGTRWIEVPGGSHSRLHRDAPELYARAMRELIRQIARPETAAPHAPRP